MAEQRLVIDDEGDVDLLVGVGKKRLRVSSKVLKMASQVFRVMFSDKYREGTELRQNSTTIPIEVPLPEDEAQGMTQLCMALHLSTGVGSVPASATEIRAVAILAEKYDCIKAIKFIARAWMQNTQIDGSIDAAKHYCALVECAWLLDDELVFRTSTKQLMLNIDGPMSSHALQPAELLLLSDYAIEQLTAETLAAARQVLMQLEIPTVQLAYNAKPGVQPTGEHGGKTYVANPNSYITSKHDWMAVTNYILTLQAAGTPLSAIATTPLIVVKNRLQTYINSPACTAAQASPAKPSAVCRACAFDMQGHLKAVVQEIETSIKGLCLDCVKRQCKICDPSTCRKTV